jgi:AcrR family transcriptional regulator
MTFVSRAAYHSPRRQQAAAATRDAILEATRELFAAQGYAQTTVGQIADAAQVAPNTVYTSVGGKPQLLRAITEEGIGDPSAAETRAALGRTTDPAQVIRLTAAGVRRVHERQAQGIAILLDSAKDDPVAAELHDAAVRHCRQALDQSARRLQELNALPSTEEFRASDVLWYLFGFASWRTLITDLRWGWDEAELWLAQRGIDALLTRPSRRR